MLGAVVNQYCFPIVKKVLVVSKDYLLVEHVIQMVSYPLHLVSP